MRFGNPPPKPEQNQANYAAIRPVSSVQPAPYTLKTESDFAKLLHGGRAGVCGYCGYSFYRGDGDECPVCWKKYTEEAAAGTAFPVSVRVPGELRGNNQLNTKELFELYQLRQGYYFAFKTGKISADEANWAKAELDQRMQVQLDRELESYHRKQAEKRESQTMQARLSQLSNEYHGNSDW